jgi:hypothetical protein
LHKANLLNLFLSSPLAVFVEGQTEQLFVETLIYEIAGRHNIQIDTMQGFGGNTCPRQFLVIQGNGPDPSKGYYVVIYDSGGDSSVLSDIRDNYKSLIANDFEFVIGIRDVHPLPSTDIPTIRSDFVLLTPTSPIKPLLVLAIMEIEAWFIAEYTHFERRHATLTPQVIASVLGYDPNTHDVQVIASPTTDLKNLYATVHIGYSKKRQQVEAIVSHLDYSQYYLVLPAKVPDLKNLVDCIEAFLS